MTDWTDLPNNIWESIARLMTLITDFINFGAVCPSWRSIAAANRQHLPPQLPWLLLPADNTVRSMKRRVYTLSDSRVANFHLPVPHNKMCVGSIGGWLVTVDLQQYLKVFNPFSGTEISLPRLRPFSILQPIHLLVKVVLSSPPASPVDRNFIVAAICNEVVAFWKPGEETWKLVYDVENIDDIVYYKKQFYAVTHRGEVWVFNLSSRIPDTIKYAAGPDRYRFLPKRYLVVSSDGDLLQVARYIISSDETDYETRGFRVFKLCTNDKSWSRITDLNSDILFLGQNTSFSISASHFSSFRGNCIYFTDDIYREPYAFINGNSVGAFDMGVFDMENQTIRPHYVKNPGEVLRVPPIWITPVLH